jgi:DeoR family glycerol-3-phosphate regulon repressor
MKLSRRQQLLNEYVHQQGYATIDDLADRFGVTPQTIRRDINSLSELGKLTRYHGGAAPPPSSVTNLDYGTRQILNREAKERIGQKVAEFIPDHSSLFINIGTTTEAVAQALIARSDLRVITNNLNVAAMLYQHPGIEVIVAGGVVRTRDGGITGEATIDFIRQFKVDFGIIGISGIEQDGTLLDFDYHEVRVAQAILEQSRRVLLVADHSKFNRNALVRLAGIEAVDVLFTDSPIPESVRARMQAAGVEWVTTDSPAPPATDGDCAALT